ncbi:hypothetical protein HMPREF3212_02651 [Citrobacter freundii]|nr:hypothetical protein HMPREF3212_02651 [Citrobacter freundii]
MCRRGAGCVLSGPRCEQHSRSENPKHPELNFYLCIFASGITLIPAKNVICAVNISLFPLFVLFLSGLLDTI